MSFQCQNGITTLATYTYSRATVGEDIFYRISRWQTRTGSNNNFAIFRVNNINPIWKSARCHDINIWPIATMGDIFSTVKVYTSDKPEVLITSLLLQIEMSFKSKRGYKASRTYTISTDSGRHHRSPNIQDDNLLFILFLFSLKRSC